MSERNGYFKARFFGGTLDGESRDISKEKEYVREYVPINLSSVNTPIGHMDVIETRKEIYVRTRVLSDDTAEFHLKRREDE